MSEPDRDLFAIARARLRAAQDEYAAKRNDKAKCEKPKTNAVQNTVAHDISYGKRERPLSWRRQAFAFRLS